MPSKKPTKAAKRSAKASPRKTTRKVVSSKKAARAPAKPTPKHTAAKVAAKPSKPILKPVAAKPIVKAPRVKAAAPLKPLKQEAAAHAPKANPVKVAPIRFDPRPLIMPPRTQQHDEDGEDSAASAGLLAGPRNVKPYIARRGEQYMNKEQLEHFARILQNWKRDLMVEVDRTVLHMKDEAANFPDPNDRATQEEEFSLELRTRDRERKLIRKIDEALKRIEDGSYGYCLETGEEIGIKRLEARPVATLSVEAQERRERREKQYGDRDDRYR
jgi:DnaK suppressor protein